MWTPAILRELERLAQGKVASEMSSTIQWVAGHAGSDEGAVVYRQDAHSWLAVLYVESINSFPLLFEPVSYDPAVIGSLLFLSEMDDPGGIGADEPPDHVRAGVRRY